MKRINRQSKTILVSAEVLEHKTRDRKNSSYWIFLGDELWYELKNYFFEEFKKEQSNSQIK